ncbi:hypothetical protein NMY22_g5655 [Coprinellus aureogranulatus]|nr:hypothetical protein NMY22_g5655 [Coprinellus aureogranulatus]
MECTRSRSCQATSPNSEEGGHRVISLSHHTSRNRGRQRVNERIKAHRQPKQAHREVGKATGFSTLRLSRHFLKSKSKANCGGSSPRSGLRVINTQTLRVALQPISSPPSPSVAARQPIVTMLDSLAPTSTKDVSTASACGGNQHEVRIDSKTWCYSNSDPFPYAFQQQTEADGLIDEIASDTIEIRLVQYYLGCNIIDSLDMVDRLVHLQLKKSRTMARSCIRGITIDHLKLGGAIRRISLQRGVDDLHFEAYRRYKGRYDLEQLINIASKYANRPSFLDPIVAMIWNPAAEALSL